MRLQEEISSSVMVVGFVGHTKNTQRESICTGVAFGNRDLYERKQLPGGDCSVGHLLSDDKDTNYPLCVPGRQFSAVHFN